MKGLRRWFKTWIGNRRGNVTMVVALSLIPMVGAVGGAVDFSRMMQLRERLQDALDSASVGAVSVNSQAFKIGSTMSGDGTISEGATEARKIFDNNLTAPADLSNLTFTANVAKQGAAIKSSLSISGKYKTVLLGLYGMDNLPITIASTSSVTVPPYIDFYLLLDNSPSMGVGATTADITKMVNNTPDQCAFACHQLDKPSTGSNRDYYSLAKSLGVTMRIDVLRQATQNLMTTAKTAETLTNQYRMAIYHFGKAADKIDAKAPTAYQVSALTSDLTLSATNAAGIDLMTMPSAGYNSDRQTNFTSTLTNLNSLVPTPGSGMTPSSTQKVVFIVSDGAMDSYDCSYSNGNSCRRITPIDTAICTTIKARGVRIAALYTTYLPLPTNSFYNTYIAKYVTAPSQLASSMQSCASPGLYFEVGPNQGISEAMNALFKKVVSVVRINS